MHGTPRTTRQLAVPAAGGRAEVDASPRLRQKIVLLVQLHEFEGGTATVTLFLGQLVELVQTPFSFLVLATHPCHCR